MQDNAKNPGSDGASPYLPALPSMMTSTPMISIDQSTKIHVRITWQGDAISPCSDGASPYLSALPVYDDVTR
jgi:hypothetical protein